MGGPPLRRFAPRWALPRPLADFYTLNRVKLIGIMQNFLIPPQKGKKQFGILLIPTFLFKIKQKTFWYHPKFFDTKKFFFDTNKFFESPLFLLFFGPQRRNYDDELFQKIIKNHQKRIFENKKIDFA